MLHEVTRILLQPNKKEITTYKLLIENEQGQFLSMDLHHIHIDERGKGGKLTFFRFYPIGEWASCYMDYRGREWPNINLTARTTNQQYPTGFHCFLKLEEAKEVYNEFIKNRCYDNIKLCKCQSKYRMIFGIKKYRFVKMDEIIWADTVVCRGLKIIEVLED